MAFVNLVGGQDELVFDGGSFVVDQAGVCIARGVAFAEDFVVADVDLDAVFHARLQDSRRRKEKLLLTGNAPRVALVRPAARPASAPAPATLAPTLGEVDEIYHAL